MYKFELGEKVLLNTIRQIVFVTGKHLSLTCGRSANIWYTVRRNSPIDLFNPAGYLYQSSTIYEVKEEELSKIEEELSDTDHDMIDALRHMSMGPVKFSGFDFAECPHEWLEYEGFTSRFTYCKKCDQKKS